VSDIFVFDGCDILDLSARSRPTLIVGLRESGIRAFVVSFQRGTGRRQTGTVVRESIFLSRKAADQNVKPGIRAIRAALFEL
jgi:hypothetical protein